MDGWVDGVWGAALLKMRLAILMLLFAPTYVQARSAFEWGLVVVAVELMFALYRSAVLIRRSV